MRIYSFAEEQPKKTTTPPPPPPNPETNKTNRPLR